MRRLPHVTRISFGVSRTLNAAVQSGFLRSGSPSSRTFRIKLRILPFTAGESPKGSGDALGPEKSVGLIEAGIPNHSSRSETDVSYPTVRSPMLFACLGNLPPIFLRSATDMPAAYFSREFQKLRVFAHQESTSFPVTVFPSSAKYHSSNHFLSHWALRKPDSSQRSEVSASRAPNQRHVPLAPGTSQVSVTRLS